ncbi:V-type ATP synthase subunit I [Geoalkalibacter halelectricus]|uniref:V-type ATP synthase subunit I n=1 Tax=Geoalkalibacter halelectricus TaxID=2847045 RepID=UPI003D1AF904
MAIVALEKVTLCGPRQDKTAVLAALQSLGLVHLVSLRATKGWSEEITQRPEGAYRALRWLLDSPRRFLQISDDQDFDFDAVIAAVRHNRFGMTETRNHLETLLAQRKLLEPWGQFNPPTPDQLGGQRFWYYVVPLHQFEQMNKADLTWAVIKRDHRHVYLIVIAATEPPRERVPVPPVPIGHLSLQQLDEQIVSVRQRIEELEFQRHWQTRWISLILRELARAEDRAALSHAETLTRDESDLFVLHGWLARKDRAQVEQFAAQRGIAVFFEPPLPDDHPPTLLSNPPAVAAGEDLARFFQTPGYADWDPSRVLFFSFAAFFAMILADAGYALLLSIGLLACWKKLGRKPMTRRLRSLAAVMLAAAVGYGVLAGNYFGVSPPEGSLPAAFKVFDLDDFDTMLRLSVFIGVAHLMLANGFRAVRYWPGNLARTALGWNGLLIAGYSGWLAADQVIPEALLPLCWFLGIISALAIFVWGSDRPTRTAKDKLLRFVDGLGALTRITRAFGDVLSYMRLFALGLASAALALTFNQISLATAQALPGLGLFLAALVLILGHALNLALAMVSGVVHGLRLNFIEFYNWGLSDEGYPFRPFCKKELPHE